MISSLFSRTGPSSRPRLDTGFASRKYAVITGAFPLAAAAFLVWTGIRAGWDGWVPIVVPGRRSGGIELGLVPALPFTTISLVLALAAVAWIVVCVSWRDVPWSFVVGVPLVLTIGWGVVLTAYVAQSDAADPWRILGGLLAFAVATLLAGVMAQSVWVNLLGLTRKAR